MRKLQQIIALISMAATLQWTASVAGDLPGIPGTFSLPGKIGVHQFLDGRLPVGSILGAGISDAMTAVVRLSCLATAFDTEKAPRRDDARNQRRPAGQGTGAISLMDAARLSFGITPFHPEPVSCAVPMISIPEMPPGGPGVGISLFILFLLGGGLRYLARGFLGDAPFSVDLCPADEFHPAGFFIFRLFYQEVVRA